VPAGFKGSNSTAELAVDSAGRFLYGSNRGDDSIAVFRIGPDGRLSLLQHESTRGKTPRNFALDRSGRWLVAANQNTDSLAVFTVDPGTGKLSPAGGLVAVPAPVDVLFE
jgi:6-phosphogluconolactonase